MSAKPSKKRGKDDAAAHSQDQSGTDWDGFGQKLKETRSDLEAVTARVSELEEVYKQQLQGAGFAKMEEDYKEQLDKERSARKRIQEELQSFKDRVAKDVSASIKTGNTESMNSPVNKTKLTEMYEELRVSKWPDIKDQLKKDKRQKPEDIKARIQDAFKVAAEEMEKKKKQIDEVVGWVERSDGLPAQKVKEYRGLAVLGLQMELYHSESGGFSKQVQYSWDLLLSECHWLGRLMALNNPPLQPDWKDRSRGMDTWDIFPREFRVHAANDTTTTM